jgi:hypothetical protein
MKMKIGRKRTAGHVHGNGETFSPSRSPCITTNHHYRQPQLPPTADRTQRAPNNERNEAPNADEGIHFKEKRKIEK